MSYNTEKMHDMLKLLLKEIFRINADVIGIIRADLNHSINKFTVGFPSPEIQELDLRISLLVSNKSNINKIKDKIKATMDKLPRE